MEMECPSEETKVMEGKKEKACYVGGVKDPENPKMRRMTIAVKAKKLKSLILGQVEKLKASIVSLSLLTPFKVFVLATTTVLLLCVCVMLATMSYTMLPAVFQIQSFNNLFSHRLYKNNGYLMISPNGGLNQMRAGICDMVAVAKYLNVTLIAPELDNTSFWHDTSRFQDIFDVDYFIQSLKEEVQILKQLPDLEKKWMESHFLYSMTPPNWSNLTYYDRVVPLMRQFGIVHFTHTDTRLANEGIPEELQRLRCRANYQALRFTPSIEKVGNKIVKLLRQNGPFLALHLRYEMDMLAFSGCIEGCNETEIRELTKLRYAIPWWRRKEIDSHWKRRVGACPLTPEETSLALRALNIDSRIQIYIAAADIYGGEKRMAPLGKAFPNLIKKETLLKPSELLPFRGHLNEMAALDYIVSVESDIFIPTYEGNMAKVVEGHRRYLGFRPTIVPDRMLLVQLIDDYKKGKLRWVEFSQAVKTVHADRTGRPRQGVEVLGKRRGQAYFYNNPVECLPPIVKITK